jgi:hypothetical protein
MALLYDFSEAKLSYIQAYVSPWLLQNHLDPSRIPWRGTIYISETEISGFQFVEPRVVKPHTGTFATEPFSTPLLTAPPPEFVHYLRTAAKK